MDAVRIICVEGYSAARRVVQGFASSDWLHAHSFADVLNEDTGRGYQRPLNKKHSLDFRKYIQSPGASTIPLTFNLRPEFANQWSVRQLANGVVELIIAPTAGKIFAQVDCQHRLTHLHNVGIQLAFMCYLGLTEREEMEVFTVINGKARGLNRSLLDFHEAQLCDDVRADRPELFIALYLLRNAASPWAGQLALGGTSSSGLMRRASLRTMQKAVKRFLMKTRAVANLGPDRTAQVILDFWKAVTVVLDAEWRNPRKHVLSKGVGVYALLDIAADIFLEAKGAIPDEAYFCSALADFAKQFDWSTTGPMQGLGGEGGASAAADLIRQVRRKSKLKVARG